MAITPDISFIVPAFNAAATLLQTIASLQAQTLTNWQAIIIDDGSTDATPDIARSTRDTRISLISHPNRGLAGARNSGIARAIAPFISFLDADDTISPTFSEKMLAGLGDRDAVAC